MKIVWTQESLNKLVEIENYIALDSPNRAIKFTSRIIEKAEAIVKNPEIGRIVPEFYLPDIREIIYKKYRIIYRIGKKNIEILTVFEGHRLIRPGEIFPK